MTGIAGRGGAMAWVHGHGEIRPSLSVRYEGQEMERPGNKAAICVVLEAVPEAARWP